MEIKDFEKLKKDIEEAKSKRSRIEGVLEQDMKRLKDEYKCNSIEEAEKKLDELNKEIDEGEIALYDLMKQIEELAQWDKI